jgi:hypothetical protein
MVARRRDEPHRGHGIAPPFPPGTLAGMRCLITALVLLTAVAAFAAPASAAEKAAAYQPKDGDVIFQGAAGDTFGDLIKGLSKSEIAHCGLVYQKAGKWVVLEANGANVHETPLPEFIKKEDGQYRAERLKDQDKTRLAAMIKAAQRFLGRPYDMRFTMGDDQLYCSELVYKAYRAAYQKELAPLVKLGDLAWRPFEAQIQLVNDGKVPTDLQLVLPAHLAASNQLEVVSDHFRK